MTHAADPAAEELNPYNADVIECPYPMYERMREQGTYFLEPADAWIVTRWEDVQFVLKRSDLFSNLPAVDPHGVTPEQARAHARETGALPGSDPPEHTHYRRLAGAVALEARGGFVRAERLPRDRRAYRPASSTTARWSWRASSRRR